MPSGPHPYARARPRARARRGLLALLIAGFALLPGGAGATPGSQFTGTTAARYGSALATDISTGTPHFSWLNTSGGAVDRQRVEVWTTPPTDVVAHWRLDGNGQDSSGNDRHLTTPAAPAAPSYVAGQPGFGQAASFDGTDDYLHRPLDTAFNLANEFTVEAWFRVDPDATGDFYIVEKGGGNNRRFTLTAQDDGEVEALVTVGGVDQYVDTPNYTAALGQWHHAALTVDASNTCRLYVDGVKYDEDTSCGPVDGGANDPVVIGRFGKSSGGFFDGQIDEVRISSVARTAEEIRGAYLARAPFAVRLWDSDPSDDGITMPSCASGERCADVVYGSTGTAAGLSLGGARYWVRAKHRLGSAAWTPWSSWSWFETQAPDDGTFVATDGCSSTAATSFGSLLPGAGGVTSEDCRISFGSSGSSSLRLMQADGSGSALHGFMDGTLDPTFGSGGTATVATGDVELLNDLEVLPDGSIITVGEDCYMCRFLIAKLRPDGSFDSRFGGGDGIVKIDFPDASNDDTATAVDVAPDGRIVVGGYTRISGVQRLALTRLLPDGTLDTTFGTNGFVVEPSYGTVSDVKVRSNGGLLVTTTAFDTSSHLLRFLPDGSRDPGTAITFRAMVRIPSPPSAQFAPIDLAATDGSNWATSFLMVRPDGTIRAGFMQPDDTFRGLVDGSTIAWNTWTRFEGSVDVSGSTWTMRWSIDGVEQPATSWTMPGGSYTFGTADLGINQCGCIATVYLDDVALSSSTDDYPLGDGRVLGYTADTVGTHAVGGSNRIYKHAANGCSGSDLNAGDSAPQGWTMLDDWPVTTGAGADLVSVASSSAGYVEHEFAPTAETAHPNGVQLVYAHREAASTGGNVVTVTPVHGGTTGSAITRSPTTTLQYARLTMPDRPGGSGWQASDIGSLRFRISSANVGATNVRVDAVLAEVDFPAGAGLAAPSNTIPPGIIGGAPPEEGDLLAATTGSWSGTQSIAYALQWQRCTPGCSDIAGATDATYLVTVDDVGATVRVRVTASNEVGSANAVSTTTATVLARASQRPEMTELPALSGGTVVGRTLSATHGLWDGAPTAWAMQWERCSARGDDCTPITGATSPTRTLAGADVGSRLRMRVTATNAAGSSVAFSAPGPLVKASAPSLVSLTGFEAGLVDATGGGLAATVTASASADVAATTDGARSGTRGLRLRASGAGGDASVELPDTPSGLTRVARFYVRVDELPASGSVEIAAFDDGSTSAAIHVTAAGRFTARSHTGTLVTGATTQRGRWYRIDARHATSGTTHTLEWMVDGAAQPTASHAAAGDGTGTWVRLSATGLDAGENAAVAFDDYALSATAADYPIGAGAVRSMTVTTERSAGHVNPTNFRSDAGVAFTPLDVLRIDDEPWSLSGDDFVRQQTAGASWLSFHLSDPDDAWEANAVRGLVQYHGTASGTMNGSTQLTTSSGTHPVYVGNMAVSSPRAAGAVVPMPAAGWTRAELAGLHMRIGNAPGPFGVRPIWDALLVEVDLPR